MCLSQVPCMVLLFEMELSPPGSCHNREAEVKFGWRMQEERNGLDPIPLSCGFLGILEHLRHLKVLTHPFFIFFFLRWGFLREF